METKGKLHKKFDTQKVSDKFQKREFILATETETKYPQYVTFQVTQDKCSLLDKLTIGSDLTIQFNLRGRLWNGSEGEKAFNTLEAWRISNVAAEHDAEQKAELEDLGPSDWNNGEFYK